MPPHPMGLCLSGAQRVLWFVTCSGAEWWPLKLDRALGCLRGTVGRVEPLAGADSRRVGCLDFLVGFPEGGWRGGL